MTKAKVESVDEAADGHPRRIVFITVAVLLPDTFNDAYIEDITPVAIDVIGYEDTTLTDFIQTSTQEARLWMT